MVQAALNRKPRASRGGRSPIELTTTIVPAPSAHTLVTPGLELYNTDHVASKGVEVAVEEMARLLEEHWDLADRSRRVMSAYNRKRTCMAAMPRIDIGDYVLYAVHKPDTKLGYVWRGPGVVLRQLSPLVYEVKPAGIEHASAMEVHVCKLRRFATASLHMSEQIRTDLARDHPDNVVSKLVDHVVENDTMWFKCRWKGFSKAVDSWQTSDVLQQDCPETIRSYARRLQAKGKMDDALQQHIEEAFPADSANKLRIVDVEDHVLSDTDSSDTGSEPAHEHDTIDAHEPDMPERDTSADGAATPELPPVTQRRVASRNATASVSGTPVRVTRSTRARPAATQQRKPTAAHHYPLRVRTRR